MNYFSPNILPETPAFIIDERIIADTLRRIGDIAQNAGCRLLYSLKALAIPELLSLIQQHVAGFSVSSYFEARLAREILKDNGVLHLTSPGLRTDEIEKISKLCDFVSFNSFSQFQRLKGGLKGLAKAAIRVNPRISIVADPRYDPCRQHSKLGIGIDDLKKMVADNSVASRELIGLHFHTSCEGTCAKPLYDTVQYISHNLSNFLHNLKWINLGGGYFYQDMKDVELFNYSVNLLCEDFGLEVYIEPGEAVVGRAVFLVSSVLDIFESDGEKVAVLDTSVNHMPQVFEYQYQPPLLQASEYGPHRYILAGSTCLAGDIFGQYSFDLPLKVGQRVVFSDAGAYTLVKAHMFNGLNLPSIHAIKRDGSLALIRKFGYADFWKESVA